METFNWDVCVFGAWWQETADKGMQASREAFEELGGFLSRVQAALLEEQGEALTAAEGKAKVMVEELGEEIAHLQKRRSELEQLQHTQEHLHLLQVRVLLLLLLLLLLLVLHRTRTFLLHFLLRLFFLFLLS